MRKRWLPVVLLAAGIVLANLFGRLAVWLWAPHNDHRQAVIGVVAFVVIAVAAFAAALRWVRRYPMPRVGGDFLVAIGGSVLISVLINPLLLGRSPFADGVGVLVRQVWWLLVVAVGSAAFGALVIMTLGQDWKSRAWKRYEHQVASRPRRVVRR